MWIILLVLFALVVIIICLFSGIIFPVWMIVHAAKSKTISDQAKTAWIISLIFLWTIASIPYAIFISQSKKIKNLAIFQLILLAIFAAIYFYSKTIKPSA